MDNKQSEELQSRREFFKKAVKAAMPVVGAVVLASLPNIATAATGCEQSCSGGCMGSCMGSCAVGCVSACAGNCSGSCMGTSTH